VNTREHDELVHQFGQEPLWRESLFFNWHDAGGEIAGTATIGIRPNQHRYEGLAMFFVKGRVLFFHMQGPLQSNDNLYSVPGLTFVMEKPVQRWRVEVSACFFEVEKPDTFSKETIAVDCHLSFDAVNPAYNFPERGLAEMGIAAGHYEQCGRFRGGVSVGGEVYEVNGLGFRDHSWGVRNLQKAGNLVCLFAQFADDFTVNAALGRVSDQEMAIGYVWHNGRNNPITGMHASVKTDSQGLPSTVTAQVAADGLSSLDIQADVKAVMPIALKQDRITLRWCECFTWFKNVDEHQRSAYGILETTQIVNS
jgi:hypothetical protein